MRLSELKSLYEARDQNENRLFKYCTFDWILDLLKDGKVYSYNKSLRDQKIENVNDETDWIALTTKRSSTINQYLEEYGTIEVTFDKELLKINNDVFIVNFNTSWLDKRPSITKFITKGKYSNSKDYFRKNYQVIDWSNNDNFSRRFFNDYMIGGKIDIDSLLDEVDVEEIEDYIYDTNYTTFENFINSLGTDQELVLVRSPLTLVNDAILQIIVPRRYKEKIKKYEIEYKIRYE